MRSRRRRVVRLCGLLGLCALALQLAFAARLAMMAWIDPASTSLQRSEILRLLLERGQVRWQWTWVDETRVAGHLKRAVIASEDAGFLDHRGVEWEALEQAWQQNLRREKLAADAGRTARSARLRGGSTITQQLAKNLLLSGERNLWRKAQELVLTWTLEAVLDKRRILELYLNHVEWGEGLFGAQAAARHYHRVDALRLSAEQAARLAVMLPAPKRFQKRPASEYLVGRSAVVLARMGAARAP